jgi:putative salt-induced outer membrane protein YdiY
MMAMNDWKRCLATVCLAGMAVGVFGDVVELDNGARLVGKVQSVETGKITLETDYAGTLTLDMARVTAFSTDAPVFVALQSGNKLLGTVAHDAESTRIETVDGTMTVKPDSLVAAWQEGKTDPTLPKPPPPRVWSYELYADITGKTGNSEKFRLGAGAKAVLEGPEDRLMLYARGARARDNGQNTEDEILGGMDFERRFLGKHSWYARTELERDDIEGIDMRSIAGLGYGYYFIDREQWKLRGRVGALYRHESYVNGDSNSDIALDLGLNHRARISDWADLVTDITYTPAFGDFSDYRLYHVSSIDIPLDHSDVWKLRLGVSNEYNSQVIGDAESLDTTYFARLVMNWGK